MTVVIIDIEINLLKGEQIRTRQFIQNIILISFKAWRQAFVAILIRFLSHIFRVSRMHTLWADGEVDIPWDVRSLYFVCDIIYSSPIYFKWIRSFTD